jgi:hypothetical protein
MDSTANEDSENRSVQAISAKVTYRSVFHFSDSWRIRLGRFRFQCPCAIDVLRARPPKQSPPMPVMPGSLRARELTALLVRPRWLASVLILAVSIAVLYWRHQEATGPIRHEISGVLRAAGSPVAGFG